MTPSMAVALTCFLTARVMLTAAASLENAEANLKIVYSDHPHPASSLPQVIHYRVTIGGNASVLLRLHRRTLELDTLPVFARKNNQITRVDLQNASQDVVGFYQAVDTATAVALKIREEPNATCHEMRGTLHLSNSWMSILPASTKIIEARHETVHVLRKLKPEQADYSHTSPPKGSQAEKVYKKAMLFAEARKKQWGSLATARRSRQTEPRYNVGILIVVDYSAFKRIELGLKLNNPAPSVEDVLREVRFYCAQAENMVNVQYRSIQPIIVNIGTTLKAIYVETAPSGNTWLDKWTVPGADPQRLSIDSTTVLLNFTSWVTANLKNLSLPAYDHASLFTGYDLSSQYNETAVTYDTVGIAWLARTCSGNGTSVIEMTGALGEGRTLAHELGHSLGAQHDGDGNYCRATDQYIMSAISKPSSGMQSTNSFRFSSCSQFEMAAYIEALNSYGVNCLLDDEHPYNETEWTHEIAVIPGQLYSASEQCKQAYGPTYSVCGGAILGSNVCEKLWCYDTKSPTLGCIVTGLSGKAVDGTPCGNKKWCERGACVYNSSAPVGSDYCPLGDIGKDLPVFSDEHYTCSNMPSYYCQDKDVYAHCCKTCSNRYDSVIPAKTTVVNIPETDTAVAGAKWPTTEALTVASSPSVTSPPAPITANRVRTTKTATATGSSVASCKTTMSLLLFISAVVISQKL